MKRRASKRSSQEPSSRSSVTFIVRNSATINTMAGNTAGLAMAAPTVIASSQQTAAMATKSARPYARAIK